MTRLMIGRILFHGWLARNVPSWLGGYIDDMGMDLMIQLSQYKPLPSEQALAGWPWYGMAVCESINCRHKWAVFAPDGVDVDIELICPSCEDNTGSLV